VASDPAGEIPVLTYPLEPSLHARFLRPEGTEVRVGAAVFGGEEVVFVAGPCAVETRDQLLFAAEAAAEAGARVLRGGAFKPRTSPYAFQGLGEAGLELLREVADRLDLAVVTEVMSADLIPLVSAYADMLQIGSRSIQNFPLLEAVGRADRPVLLKRGMMSTVDEFLSAAEYVLKAGNSRVVLCERGIRTFETRTRNTFDVVAIPLLKSLTHLPVIADPSHATGHKHLVAPAALAAVAAGADGLLVEVHGDPSSALCDGPQALLPEEFRLLARACRRVAEAVGRR
jgi:3-deoxy-7-phosphoheptulonate synthase